MAPSAPGRAPSLATSRVAASAGFAAQGFALAVLLTSTPAFTHRYGLSIQGLTVLVACLPFLAAAGNLVAARVAGRRGSAPTLRAGLLLLAVGLAAIAASPSLPTFVVAFAVYAAAVGVVDLGTNMQAVELEHRYGRSILVGFFAVWSIAAAVGALWTSLTARTHESLPLRLTLPCVVALAAAGMGRGLLRADPAEEHVLAEQHLPHAGAGPAPRLPWARLWPLGVAVLIVFLVDSSMTTWTTQYMHDVLAASSAVAALGVAGYQAASVVARLGADQVVRRWGPAWVVRLGGVVGCAGLVAVAGATGPALAVAGACAVGLAVASVTPLSFAAAGRLDPSRTDDLVAQLNLFNYLGVVLGAAMVGILGSLHHFRVAFLVPGLLTAGLVLLAGAFAVGLGDGVRSAGEGEHRVA